MHSTQDQVGKFCLATLDFDGQKQLPYMIWCSVFSKGTAQVLNLDPFHLQRIYESKSSFGCFPNLIHNEILVAIFAIRLDDQYIAFKMLIITDIGRNNEQKLISWQNQLSREMKFYSYDIDKRHPDMRHMMGSKVAGRILCHNIHLSWEPLSSQIGIIWRNNMKINTRLSNLRYSGIMFQLRFKLIRYGLCYGMDPVSNITCRRKHAIDP